MVRAAFVVAAVGALAACGRPDARPPSSAVAPPSALPPVEAAESLAARLERRRPSLVRRAGSLTAGDATSEWTGYFAGDTLHLVDDSLSLGDYGGSRSQFYYEDARLRYYREEGSRVRMGRDATGMERHSLRVAFDEAGAVLVSRFVIDGRDTTLPDTRLADVRRRGTDFLRAAAALTPPR